MLVRGKYVIADADSAVIEDGAVRIERDRITDVGYYRDLNNSYPHDDVIGSDEFAILPGLINAHDHARVPSALQLGIADDFLEQWLVSLIGIRAVDPYLSTALTAIQSLESGVTTVVHSFYEPSVTIYENDLNASVQAYRESGLRAAMVLSILDASPISATLAQSISSLSAGLQTQVRKFLESRRHLALIDYFAITREWQKKIRAEEFARVSILLGPVSAHWCSDELLLAVREEAQATGAPLQTHLLETIYQRRDALKKYGKSMVEHLAEIGFLNPLLSCAHGVWVTERDIELLSAHGVSVVHNPGSNMRLGSGIAPVNAMAVRGVNVALGVDSISMNDDGDMFQEMRLAALLQRVPGTSGLTGNQVLNMATRAGARVCGRDDIGTLAPGKKADLILLRLEKILYPYTESSAGIIDMIVQRAHSRDVETVIVEGEMVMHGRKLKKIDKDAIVAKLRDQLSRNENLQLDETRRFLDMLKPSIRKLFVESLDDSTPYQFNVPA